MDDSGHRSLAGHWLAGGGRAALEQRLGLSRRSTGWGRLVVRTARVPTYLTVMLAGSLGLVAAVYAMAGAPINGWTGHAIAALEKLIEIYRSTELPQRSPESRPPAERF